MIYHVVTKALWDKALELGYYAAPSLATEGFIHLSKEGQVRGVLERYYRNQPDLLLLHVDEDRLTHELKYEHSPSLNELFPHLFGVLNLDAVVEVTSLTIPV